MFEERLNFGRTRDIALSGGRDPAPVRDQTGTLVRGVAVDVGDDYLRFLTRGRDARSPADTASTAGYDGYSIAETAHLDSLALKGR